MQRSVPPELWTGLPDLASLCCPGGLMVIHGRKDQLFTEKGVANA